VQPEGAIIVAVNDTPCKADYRVWVDGVSKIIDEAKIISPYYHDKSDFSYYTYNKLSEVPKTISESNSVYQAGGGATAALHLLWLMGCEKIHVLGIDGGGGYSASYNGNIYTPEHGLMYAKILEEFNKLKNHLNIWTLT